MGKILIYQKGQKIGNMWFFEEEEKDIYGRRAIFLCSCGNKKSARISAVKRKSMSSCGCIINKNKIIHGDRSNKKTSKEYKSWRSIKKRIMNKNNQAYERYGGRGIKICDRWLEDKNGFVNFLNDMGRKPTPQHTIDRIDNNGNYCPENCRWATKTEQGRNKRNNIILIINSEAKTLSEWMKETKMSRSAVCDRLKKGYSHYDALFLPKKY